MFRVRPCLGEHHGNPWALSRDPIDGCWARCGLGPIDRRGTTRRGLNSTLYGGPAYGAVRRRFASPNAIAD